MEQKVNHFNNPTTVIDTQAASSFDSTYDDPFWDAVDYENIPLVDLTGRQSIPAQIDQQASVPDGFKKGFVACKHHCKDKNACRHQCCREGVPAPKNSSKKAEKSIPSMNNPSSSSSIQQKSLKPQDPTQYSIGSKRLSQAPSLQKKNRKIVTLDDFKFQESKKIASRRPSVITFSSSSSLDDLIDFDNVQYVFEELEKSKPSSESIKPPVLAFSPPSTRHEETVAVVV